MEGREGGDGRGGGRVGYARTAVVREGARGGGKRVRRLAGEGGRETGEGLE